MRAEAQLLKTASKRVCRHTPPGLPPTWLKQKRIKNDHSNDDDQHETETDTTFQLVFILFLVLKISSFCFRLTIIF
jgi:hypothetical protein